MMDGYYCVAFAEATEEFLAHVGFGPGYREETNSSIYTVESHLCYFKSVRYGERLRYATQLLGADAKRMHVFHRMTLADSGDEVATNELMFLHVDIATERAAPAESNTRIAVRQNGSNAVAQVRQPPLQPGPRIHLGLPGRRHESAGGAARLRRERQRYDPAVPPAPVL